MHLFAYLQYFSPQDIQYFPPRQPPVLSPQGTFSTFPYRISSPFPPGELQYFSPRQAPVLSPRQAPVPAQILASHQQALYLPISTRQPDSSITVRIMEKRVNFIASRQFHLSSIGSHSVATSCLTTSSTTLSTSSSTTSLTIGQ